MKNSIYIIALMMAGCSRSEKNEDRSGAGVQIDPLTKSYILHNIKDHQASAKTAYYFIYPAYCGACTDSIMKLINGNPLKSYHSYYVFRDVDSAQPAFKQYPAGTTRLMPAVEMGRHGLESAHNLIYLFDDTTCIYEAKLTATTVPQVRKELAAIEASSNFENRKVEQ